MPETKFIFAETDLFPQCHGSTLALLPDGRIISAWFGGTRESDPDTAIYAATLDPDADKWNDPWRLVKVNDEPHWNPVLFMAPTGDLHLWFKTGEHPWAWKTWHSMSPESTLEFANAEVLEGQDGDGGHCRGPVRNKPIALSDGTWLAPSSHEEKKKIVKPKLPYQLVPAFCEPRDLETYWGRVDVWNSFADLSTDNGKTWQMTPYIDRPEDAKSSGGIIQPAAWESSPGNVHMVFRSTWGAIYRSDSTDGGKTWCRAYRTKLPNNNSGIDVCYFGDDALALVFNPISGNWAGRGVLSVAFSNDNGKTWLGGAELEGPRESEDPYAYPFSRGSFSYPSTICTPDGMAITYTWSRVSICCVQLKIDTEALKNGSAPDKFCELKNPQRVPIEPLKDRLSSRYMIRRQAKRDFRMKNVEANRKYGDGVVDWQTRDSMTS